MSHKKAGGSTHLGRDSNAQRLGVKLHEGEIVKTGMIIVRQRGTKIHPGTQVKKAKDDTLFAAAPGRVKFTHRKRLRFDGTFKKTTFANIIAI
jgi:large subunit ribosomal protein L27